MFSSLPILVFGTLLMMWSRTSLTSAKQPVKDKADNKIIVEIVQSDKAT